MSLDGVTVRYGETVVLDDLTLEATASRTTALMRRMNAAAEAAGEYRAGAAVYRGEAPGPGRGPAATAARILGWTARHLLLVGVSLALAVALGLPLGIRAARGGLVGRIILATTGAIYTVPSPCSSSGPSRESTVSSSRED